ncbi:hypothetical protein [Rhizobium sp. WCS2018Hpa-8]
MDCLSKGHFGHLACSKDGHPYIVPVTTPMASTGCTSSRCRVRKSTG